MEGVSEDTPSYLKLRYARKKMSFTAPQEFWNEMYEAKLHTPRVAAERRLVRSRWKRWWWRTWFTLRGVEYPTCPWWTPERVKDDIRELSRINECT